MHHEPAPTVSLRPEHRTRDRRIGLAMIAGAFALSIGISLWAKRVSGPEIGSAPAPASTHGIYGWPNHVDSLKTLPVARTLTPRNQLRGIIVDGSKSDGTVDLREGGEIKFMFQSSPGQARSCRASPASSRSATPAAARTSTSTARGSRPISTSPECHVPAPRSKRFPSRAARSRGSGPPR